MSKIEFDKYYTPVEVVEEITEQVKLLLGNTITEVVEPSAGNGAFIESVKSFGVSYKLFDLYPEHSEVLQQDYLETDIPYKIGRLVLGNPPFGSRSTLIKKFFKKSIEIADYVAFILPISQLNNTKQLYEFDLIHSVDLGVKEYSGVPLHCCFNIYKRPKGGVLNKPYKAPTVEGLEIVEYRRDKEDTYRKKVKDGYFHSIGSWGNGSVGVIPQHIGYFSMELYFYSEDENIQNVVMSTDWKKEIKSISGCKLPKGTALEIIKAKLALEGFNEWNIITSTFVHIKIGEGWCITLFTAVSLLI